MSKLKCSVKAKLSHTRQSAKSRGLEFNLTEQYVANLIKQEHCAYSGKKFTNSDVMTFERLDNAKGYVMGNVVPVTHSLNNLRGNLELSDLIQNLVFCEYRRKVGHLAFFDLIWAKHREEAKARSKKIELYNEIIENLKNSDLKDRDQQISFNTFKRDMLIKALKYNFNHHKKEFIAREKVPVSLNKLRNLVYGMISYTKLDACEKYNLAKGFNKNNGL